MQLQLPFPTQVKSKEAASALLENMGALGGRLEKLFAFMKLTEQAISDGILKHPEDVTLINGLFPALRPPDVFFQYPLDDRVYLAHAAELIERALRGDSLQPGTGAEVLLCLVVTSYRAPMNRDAAALYTQLFTDIMGFDWAVGMVDHIDNETVEAKVRRMCRDESWAGATREMLIDARRKIGNSHGIEERK